jgi:predicted metalloendopeptidase
MRVIRLLVPLAVLLVAVGCGTGEYSESAKEADNADRLSRDEIAASVRAAMDPSVDPCEDFYRYACGGWLDSTEIPGDQSRWGRGFSVIAERNREVLREVLEDAAAHPDKGDADWARMGNYYGACMDEEAVNAAGVTPLQPWLDEIAAAEDTEAVMALAGKLLTMNVNVLFGVGVIPDFKNPDMNIGFFVQGGLGLPDRDYYVSDDPQKQGLLQAYEAHVARMLGFLGETEEEAAANARKIVAFETELAQVSRPRQEMRDPEKLYNKIDASGLKKLTPEIPWDAFMEGMGYPDIQHLNVAVPEFFEALQGFLKETPSETLQAYLRWNLINATTGLLTEEIVQANFEFYGQMLQGQQEIRPRWKRCVAATDAALGEILARFFVERQFAGDSKKKALEMVHGIEKAFDENLPALAWMDDDTRGRAVEKSKAVTNKIGYPDKWRDYSSVETSADDYFGSAMSATRFEFHRNAKKVGKPVDRKEWFMTPPTVNAYYNPTANEMVFPAGILQPPFFHRDHPAAMNFGGIGMVVGHELTHGFDDQGRKFDGKGQMTQWWEDEAIEKFEERATCVADLYETYEIQPGVHLNGRLTLGENIADIGGIKESYNAFQNWKEENWSEEQDTEERLLDELTQEQLFFVGFAQTWCTLATEEVERMLVTVDPHSPPEFRVNGPVANLREFADAFQCEVGTPMNPEKICEVW